MFYLKIYENLNLRILLYILFFKSSMYFSEFLEFILNFSKIFWVLKSKKGFYYLHLRWHSDMAGSTCGVSKQHHVVQTMLAWRN